MPYTGHGAHDEVFPLLAFAAVPVIVKTLSPLFLILLFFLVEDSASCFLENNGAQPWHQKCRYSHVNIVANNKRCVASFSASVGSAFFRIFLLYQIASQGELKEDKVEEQSSLVAF